MEWDPSAYGERCRVGTNLLVIIDERCAELCDGCLGAKRLTPPPLIEGEWEVNYRCGREDDDAHKCRSRIGLYVEGVSKRRP